MRAILAVCCLFIAALLGGAPAQATERILDYHADISIAADGGMQVAESIQVQAEGARIRHGIYRDFPTEYRDRHHQRVHIDFTVLDATLDGASVAWHTERRDNGTRVYLGDAATMLAPGPHTFVLNYHVTRELGFFADHDELYWNVNGTGWDFPVDHIGASIALPQDVPAADLRAFGYTGGSGARDADLTATTTANGATYAGTRPLAPHENLSIVLTFPKGIVTAPTSAQKLRWLLRDNRNLLWGLLGLIVLWGYYLPTWRQVGRDPPQGPLVAAYEPPDGLSAAALRFVRRMRYDNTCFTAGVLGLAAKNVLTISQQYDDKWLVQRRAAAADAPALQADEQTLRDALFAGGDKLVFDTQQHARVAGAGTALQRALKTRFESTYFHTNAIYLLPGLAITVVAALLAASGGDLATTLFMLVWLSVWSIGVVFLILSAIRARGDKGAVAMWFVAAIFSCGEVLGLVMLGLAAGWATIPVFLALAATNVAFHFWMRAPTGLGAKLLDRIRGFRWYLGVAEKQELDSRYRPESRPELFAAYLPYALALDVGNAWAQRFADALTPAQMEAARPGWYTGNGTGNFNPANLAGFSSGMASGLGGAIASSSVAPGSSSGSSGGSGGGGGGGGGGGW